MSNELNTLSIPSHLGERTRAGFNTKYLVGGLLLLTFVGFLIFQV